MLNDVSVGEFCDGVYVRLVWIYYEDMDFLGIVYYVNYLCYLECGCSDCLRFMGIYYYELMVFIFFIVWMIICMEIDFLCFV